jgi:hypothetical protein
MVAGQIGERTGSTRESPHAAGIIEIQGPKLDVGYVERWAAALDIEDQLRAARQKAR